MHTGVLGSIKVEMEIEPADGDTGSADDAVSRLEDHLSSGKPLAINGKELKVVGGSISKKSASKNDRQEESPKEEEEDNHTLEIVLGVVFGLIGLAIIIAIIVIVLR